MLPKSGSVLRSSSETFCSPCHAANKNDHRYLQQKKPCQTKQRKKIKITAAQPVKLILYAGSLIGDIGFMMDDNFAHCNPVTISKQANKQTNEMEAQWLGSNPAFISHYVESACSSELLSGFPHTVQRHEVRLRDATKSPVHTTMDQCAVGA